MANKMKTRRIRRGIIRQIFNLKRFLSFFFFKRREGKLLSSNSAPPFPFYSTLRGLLSFEQISRFNEHFIARFASARPVSSILDFQCISAFVLVTGFLPRLLYSNPRRRAFHRWLYCLRKKKKKRRKKKKKPPAELHFALPLEKRRPEGKRCVSLKVLFRSHNKPGFSWPT